MCPLETFPLSNSCVLLCTTTTLLLSFNIRILIFLPAIPFDKHSYFIIMKLSDRTIAIETAFETLMSSLDDPFDISQLHQDYHGQRVRRDLSRCRYQSSIPCLIPTYEPETIQPSFDNKEKLLLLAAFEATYHEAQTPISPDMAPLILDTGACITVTPYETDFISEIRPVQAIEIKGIASGLSVKGFGDVSYSFYNDNGELQTMGLHNCLYVPKCTTRLLCP